MTDPQSPGPSSLTFDRSLLGGMARELGEKVRLLRDRIGTLSESRRDRFLRDLTVEDIIAGARLLGREVDGQRIGSLVDDPAAASPVDPPAADAALVTLQWLHLRTLRRPLTPAALVYWHELLNDQHPGAARAGTPSHWRLQELRSLADYCDRPTQTITEAVERAGMAFAVYLRLYPTGASAERIGHLLLQRILARQLGGRLPFSLSAAFATRVAGYRAAVDRARDGADITAWMVYLHLRLLEAADSSLSSLSTPEGMPEAPGEQASTQPPPAAPEPAANHISDDEARALARLMDPASDIYADGLTAKKYMAINKVSRATATRALTHLTQIGALVKRGKGRSTHYVLPGEAD